MCPMQHHAVQNPSRFLPAANQHLPPVPTTPHLKHTLLSTADFLYVAAQVNQGKAVSLMLLSWTYSSSLLTPWRLYTSQAWPLPVHGLQVMVRAVACAHKVLSFAVC